MTPAALTLSRLARLEQQYNGAIPPALRHWALYGPPPHVEWRKRWAASCARLRDLDAMFPSTYPGRIWRAQSVENAERRFCVQQYAKARKGEF